MQNAATYLWTLCMKARGHVECPECAIAPAPRRALPDPATVERFEGSREEVETLWQQVAAADTRRIVLFFGELSISEE